jgi:hypothetical protein
LNEKIESMSIVQKIAEKCFAVDTARYDLHYHLLKQLESLFLNNGYRVTNDYPFNFTYYKGKAHIFREFKGFIDLVATSPEHTIAIEFDTHGIPKQRSVAKLLQFNANIHIQILGGGGRYFGGRAEEVIQKIEFEEQKTLWLISIPNKILREIKIPEKKVLHSILHD